MSLLNLGFGELVALFGAISAVLVTLYLLDRSRRHQLVATLRFWQPALSTSELRQKRRIQQPWSLVLQLISMLLILLAISQLQWGEKGNNTRDHVLVLDTSAWMGARTPRGTVMDDARSTALAFVKAVPRSDRILLVRADGLATPATRMETNHAAVEQAIRASRPSASALNLELALEFAKRTQQSGKGGEIVYVGPGRVAGSDGMPAEPPQNMRVLATPAPSENSGIRRIGLRHSPNVPDQWEVFISARNYGARQQVAQLAVQFGGAPIGSKTLTLKPKSEQESTFTFHTRAAGLVEARLLSEDAYPEDNRAVLEIPAQAPLRVTVYTDRAELLRPVLAANPRVSATFSAPSAYQPNPAADVLILDNFVPASLPTLPSIWIEPPPQKSPVKVRTLAAAAKLVHWNSDHEVGAGLRTRDLILDSTEILSPEKGDVVIGESDRGPVIVARPQSPKLAVLGFHPVNSGMKYELATPLLFANLMRWVRPDIFRRWELNGGTVGSIDVELEKNVNPEAVQVVSDSGKTVPYSINGNHLRFFAGAAGTVRVQTGDREIVYSLTLPEVGESEWTIPARVRRGIPRLRIQDSPIVDLWPWLAGLGALGLLIEWILFGRGRRSGRIATAPARARQKVLQRRAS